MMKRLENQVKQTAPTLLALTAPLTLALTLA
jgi:hypothetical protein